jgi:hypothetical protein
MALGARKRIERKDKNIKTDKWRRGSSVGRALDSLTFTCSFSMFVYFFTLLCGLFANPFLIKLLFLILCILFFTDQLNWWFPTSVKMVQKQEHTHVLVTDIKLSVYTLL